MYFVVGNINKVVFQNMQYPLCGIRCSEEELEMIRVVFKNELYKIFFSKVTPVFILCYCMCVFERDVLCHGYLQTEMFPYRIQSDRHL